MDGHTYAAIDAMLGLPSHGARCYFKFLTLEQKIERKRVEKARAIQRRGPKLREPKDEPDCRLDLYLAGLNDAEIAQVVGVAQRTIHQWRKRRDFPANAACRPPLVVATHGDMLRLYDLGWSDGKIAVALRIGSSSVHRWRAKRGLVAVTHRAAPSCAPIAKTTLVKGAGQ